MIKKLQTQKNILDRLHFNLEKLTGEIKFNISFWGNLVEDGLHYNFDFDSLEKYLKDYNHEIKSLVDVYFIFAPINKQQALKIKKEIDLAINRPLVVLIQGTFIKKILDQSFQAVVNTDEFFHVDIQTERSSIDLLDILQKLESHYVNGDGEVLSPIEQVADARSIDE